MSGLGSWLDRVRAERAATLKKTPVKPEEALQPARWATWLGRLLFVAMSGALLTGGVWLVVQLLQVQAAQWLDLVLAGFATMGRVILSTGIATLLALPAGLAIGLSPRLSRLLQPVVQVVASFPSPMLYTIVLGGLALIGMGLN